MKILFSSHAVERMEQRKIKSSEVELILREPDGQIRQSNDKWIFFKRFKNRHDNHIAAVAVHREGNVFEVLTVMIHFEVKK